MKYNLELLTKAYRNKDLDLIEIILKSNTIHFKNHDIFNYVIDDWENIDSFTIFFQNIDFVKYHRYINYTFTRCIEDQLFNEAKTLLTLGFKINPRHYRYIDMIIEYDNLEFLKIFIEHSGSRLTENLSRDFLLSAIELYELTIFNYLLTYKSIINSLDNDFINLNFSNCPEIHNQLNKLNTINNF